MFEKTAIVESIDNQYIWLKLERNGYCAGCRNSDNCDRTEYSDSYAQDGDGKSVVLKIPVEGFDSFKFKTRDQVLINTSETSVLFVAALTYLLPVLSLIFFIWVSPYQNEMANIFLGGVGLVVGFIIVKLFGANIESAGFALQLSKV